MKIEIPPIINAAGLIPFLALLGSVPEVESEIILDFSALRRVSPAGLAALVATIRGWQANHARRVRLEGLERCGICAYLQRLDVLRTCGIDLPEAFERHSAYGRFVPIQMISDVDVMSREVATCLAPGGEEYGHALSPIWDLAAYVLGELGANVRQHSRGTGFVVSQASASEGLVRLAVADNGIGIRRSFVYAGFPWSRGMSDTAALRKAIEARVSSRGEPVNQGVGLTLVSGLAQQTKGWLLMATGDGILRMNPDGVFHEDTIPAGGRFQGTLVALNFRRDRLQEFYALLDMAKQEAGLLVSRPVKTTFN